MLNLSKHFVENWNKRVSNRRPTAPGIQKLINQAVRVQKGRRVVTRFTIIKTLTIYWHVEREIVITVDHYRNTAVSVYSRVNTPQHFGVGGRMGSCCHG